MSDQTIGKGNEVKTKTNIQRGCVGFDLDDTDSKVLPTSKCILSP
jgi:hypothetical protein